MQKFLRTLMLLALIAVPMASQAQGSALTTDRTYLNEDFSTADNAWTGGTTQYTGYNQLETTATPSWKFGDLAQHGVAAGHYYFNLQGTNLYKWLVSPVVDLTESGDAELRFDVALTGLSGSAAPASLGDSKKFMVLASTNGLSWTPLQTWTAEGSATDSTLASITNTYRNYSINLEAYLGQQIYLAFYVENNDRQNPAVILVDNVVVDGHVACKAVYNVAATDVTTNSITVAWENENIQHYAYRVVVKDDEGATVDSVEIGNRTITTHTTTGLTAATYYNVYVSTSCDGNNWLAADPLRVFTHNVVNVELPIAYETMTAETFANWTFANDTNEGTAKWYVNNILDYIDPANLETYTLGAATDSAITDTAWVDPTDHNLGFDAETSTWIYTAYDTVWDHDTVWTNVLYASNDGGLTVAYNKTTSSKSYVYTKVALEEGDYNLSFDWAANGENNYDYVGVMLAPETSAINGGAAITGATTLVKKAIGERQNSYTTFHVAKNDVYNLAIVWQNDNSTGNGVAAKVYNFNLSRVICYPPQNIAMVDSLSDAHHLSLNWVDTITGATTFRITAIGGGDTIVETVTDPEMPYLFGNGEKQLKRETAYAVTMVSICGEGNESNPTDAITFVTKPSCYAVQNLAVDTVSRSMVTLTWADDNNGEGTQYFVKLYQDGNAIDSVTVTGLTATFNGLSDLTAYNAEVYTQCVEDTVMSTINFKTTAIDGEICGDFVIANGTTTNEYVPVYGLYTDDYQKAHFVYPASMLSDIPVGTTINELKFYTSSPASEAWTGHFNVYMAEVEESTISAYADVTTMQMVFSGTLDATGATMDVALSTPYIYNGGNLLIAFEEDVDGNWKSCSFYGVSATGACVRGNNSASLDNVPAGVQDFLPKFSFSIPCPSVDMTVTVGDRTNAGATFTWDNPLATINEDADHYMVIVDSVNGGNVVMQQVDGDVFTYSVSTLMPSTNYNVTIAAVYADGYTFKSEPVNFETKGACNAPDSLTVSNETRIGFDLSWTQEEANVTDYDIIISDTVVTDFAAWAENMIAVSGTQYTATGLDRETQYYIYLRSNCGANVSQWREATATTKPLLDCNIEGTPVTVADGTASNSYVPFYGYMTDAAQHNQIIYTENDLANLVGKTIKSIAFYPTALGTKDMNYWTFSLGITTNSTLSALDNTTALTTVYTNASYVRENGAFVIHFETPYLYEGGNLLIDMNHTAGNWESHNFYGIERDGAAYSYNGIRNFLPKATFGVCGAAEACPTLTALAVDNIDVTTATLNWTAADADYLDGYQLYYTANATPDFEALTDADFTAVAATATSFDLTGLTGGTTYYVYMRSLCSRDNDTSAWTPAVSFLTMEPCRAATDLAAELNSRNSALVTWVNGGATVGQAANFTVIYDTVMLSADSLLNYAGTNTVAANDTFAIIPNLDYNTTYYFWVKNTCNVDGENVSSAWLGTASVTTGIAMPMVENLTAEVTHSTAMVTWQKAALAPESEWKISLQHAGDSNDLVWNTIDHMDTLYIALENEATYTVRVISVFGSEESDTAVYTFTTNAFPSACAQLGTGTASANLLYTSYGNTYSQHIYTAAELTAMGYSAGTISSLSFEYSGSSSSYSKTQSVYIGTTTLDVFSGYTASDFVTGLTLVYGPVLNSYQSGWREYQLTTPFVWDGTSNIVVGMLSNSTDGSANGWSARGTSQGTGNYRTIYRYRDNTEIDINDLASVNYGSRSLNRPNIKICFVRESNCLQPTQLTTLETTNNSATISWRPGNQETTWQYVCAETEEAAMAATPVNVNSLNVTVEGLLGDKDYHFYVRSICGDAEGDTSDWSHTTFATAVSCGMPVNIETESTANSITFTAQASETGTPESMSLRYWTGDNTPVEVPMTLVDTVYTATIDGLEQLTWYKYQLRANCSVSEGESRWTAVDSANTLCDGTITLPYTETFNNGTLTYNCWSLVKAADETAMGADFDMLIDGGFLYPAGNVAGDHAYIPTDGTRYNRYVISPVFAATDSMIWVSKVSLGRYYESGFGYMNDSVAFGYSTTTDDIESFVWSDMVTYASSSRPTRTYTNYLPADAKYVAYHFVGEKQDHMRIDEMTVRQLNHYTVAATNANPENGTLYLVVNDDTLDVAASYNQDVYEGTKYAFRTAPAEHYHFVNWTRDTNGVIMDTVSTYANIPSTGTVTASRDTNLTAHFAIDNYTLTVYNMPTSRGAAWVNIDSVVDGVSSYDKDTAFAYGTEITVHALDTVDGDGYHFLGWSTSSSAAQDTFFVSYANNYTFVPEKTMSLYAHFVIDSVDITANMNIEGAGIITGGGYNPLGSTVHMNAEAVYGYDFVYWQTAEGDTLTVAAGFDTTVVAAATFTAVFEPVPYYIYMAVNDENWGTAVATPDHGAYSDTIDLIATTTAEHYHFERWSDGNTESTRRFVLTQDTIMMAYFAIDQHYLKLAAREDMGTVALNGENVDSASFDYGTEVTVEATPNAGVAFTKWSNDETVNPYTFNLNGDTELTALFDSIIYNVVVRYDDTMGVVYDVNDAVVADSAVINVLYGEEVSLRWSNLTGFRFVNWTNNIDATTPRDTTVTYTVTSDMVINANFVDASKSNITVASADATMGAVEGNGQYAYQSAVTINAIPAEHYHFVKWVKDGETEYTEATLDFNADSDMVFIAYFEIDTVNFQFATADEEQGTVEADTTAGYLDYGTEVTLTAVANTDEHYHFTNWSDGTADAVYTLTLTADTNLVANFAIDTVTLNVVANNDLFGTVTGAGAYPYGTTVTLTAEANYGYHFANWSNDATTDTIQYVARIDGATVTANFDTNVYTVAVAYGSEDMRGNVTGAGQVKHFTSTDLVATASYGFHFVNWTNAEGAVLGTNDTLTVSPVSDTTVTANFDFDQFTITAATNDSTMGIATVVAPATVNYRDSVVITATPAEGYHLVGWSNGMQGETIRVQVIADATITATFAINTYTVAATANMAERGTVTGAGTYDWNTEATLVATANYGYVFAGWNNGVMTDTLRITVLEDTAVIANFDKAQFSATALVAEGQSAMGTATVSNATANYLDTVVFKATAAEHYQFAGWSNGLTADSINVVIASDTTLTATFAPMNYTVSVTSANATMGSVQPAGDSTVAYGTQFTATATANANYQFVAWLKGTDTVSTSDSYTFTVEDNTAIVAHFEAVIVNYTVTLSSAQPNMGTVSNGATVAEGTSFTATATANTGYHFVAWLEGNDTASHDAVYTFTVTANRTLVAHFAEDPVQPTMYTVSVSVNDAAMGTVDGGGQFEAGTTVTVTATAYAGYEFVEWRQGSAAVSTNASYTFTVEANVSLTAIFREKNSIDDVDMNDVTIYSTDSKIIVRGAENRSVYVFDVNGREVVREANAAETVEFRMANTGVYLVKVGTAAAKRVLVVR